MPIFNLEKQKTNLQPFWKKIVKELRIFRIQDWLLTCVEQEIFSILPKFCYICFRLFGKKSLRKNEGQCSYYSICLQRLGSQKKILQSSKRCCGSTSCVQVRNPNFIQILSKFYPNFIQMLSKFCPNFILFYLNFIQMKFGWSELLQRVFAKTWVEFW